jgi:transglutaminase-like putative cysteine protease
MDFYLIRHLTKFLYANQVSESLMEARMHPRSDNNQRCLSFTLSVSPRCRVFSYRDHVGNNVHHFDIPGEHSQLVMVAMLTRPLTRRSNPERAFVRILPIP